MLEALKSYEAKMSKSIDSVAADFAAVRAGRAKRHGVAFTLVASVTEGIRLDDIKKNTGNEIRTVRFNERGDLVAVAPKG